MAGTQINSQDDFSTHNYFNGLDLGERAQFYLGDLTLGILGKIAVGGIDRDVKIAGTTTTSVPGTTSITSPGGLYALQSNIGTHKQGEYTTMPELGLDATWCLSSNVKARFGYSLLYLELRWPVRRIKSISR